MSTSPIVEFVAQDLTRADLIALAALAVAGLSAIYARRQSNEARKARLSAERDARRPQRLEVFRAMEAYCRYCGQYFTEYLQGTAPGTRDLVARIIDFTKTMDQGAIHDMPEVAATAKTLEAMGWQMQRHLDRLNFQKTGRQRGEGEPSADELAVDELVEKFEAQRERLREVFAPYLHAASEA